MRRLSLLRNPRRPLIVAMALLAAAVAVPAGGCAANVGDGFAGRIILFDGSSWDGWVTRAGGPSGWVVGSDGSILVRGGDAITRREFGDFQLHLEFLCPVMKEREGQGRSNSGVYLHGRYEVQVLDSWGLPVAPNACGAVYSIAAPLANASRPPGSWQTYDIVFRAPRFERSGELTQEPRVTVIHNGVVIHNNLMLPSTTPGGLDRQMRLRGPILLQDHGDPIRYRNIWVRELPCQPSS